MMKEKLRLISQGARTVTARVRRRPYVAGSSAFAAALLGIGVLASGFGETSSADAAMAAHVSDLDATDMDSLLDARSPGSRRYGWLTDSKPARTAGLVDPPTERVLSSVRPRLPAPGIPDEPASFGPPAEIVDGVPVGPTGMFDPIGPNGVPTGPVGVPPTGPGFVPGGLPPGGTPDNPDNPPAEPPVAPPTEPPVSPPVAPPVPPIPEPATWAMLLMGFAMLGASLRRRGTRLRLHEVR